MLFGLSWYCSATEMFAEGRIPGFRDLMKNRIAKYRTRLVKSENTLVMAALDFWQGPIYQRWSQFLMNKL